MAQNIYESIKLKCTILSPLHIGTGTEIPDYEYVIKDGLFIKLNLNRVFSTLKADELDKINKLNDAGNYVGVRSFLQKKSDDRNWLNQNLVFTLPVSKEVEDKLTADGRNTLNQGLIKLNYRNNLTNKYVIPGSSIKGALRTAFLDKKSKAIDFLPKYSQEAEGILLNAFREKPGEDGKILKKFDVVSDPFKYFKVPDIELGSNISRIVFVKNMAKDGRKLKENQIQMIHEISRSYLDSTELTFEIQIELATRQMTPVRLNRLDLIKACEDYYCDKLINIEMAFFEDTPVYEYLLKIKNVVKEDEFLIRIGRFSGKCERW